MIKFIFVLIIFVISAWLGLCIAEDPGFALFSYHQWSVEMPLWFAAAALLILFYLGYLVLQLFNSVDFSLYRWKNWLRWRNRYKSYSKTNRGLLELIEGNWKNAESYLLAGIQKTDSPLINLLAAAKAAHEQGAYEKRDTYLRQAHDFAPNADVAIGLTQAQLQFDQGQLEQALATLRHLRSVAPKHPVVLKLLERVYVRLGDWQELLSLLPSLRKANLITADELSHFEKNIYLEFLHAVEGKNESEIREVWDRIPRKLKTNPELVACFARQLLNYSDAVDELDELLRKTIKSHWDPELVKLYGLLVTEKPARQLAAAEKWISLYPQQPILFLTLGNLAKRSQLWGKSKTYYETSLRLGVNPATYAAYGDLLESLKDPVAAAQSYHDGLMLAVKAPKVSL
ncbi:MAG: heme biosynthesis HemY N-terminal domain-containing protein [Gammaproteobacteria bacterium]|nr:heme biosynthesis HemY N-terminal domain-containing protein [Gammaproteobacteria bacterium]